MLTEKQKTLLYYALDAVQNTFYYNDEFNLLDYDYNNFLLNMYEFRQLANNLDELNNLIDKTLNDLCK